MQPISAKVVELSLSLARFQLCVVALRRAGTTPSTASRCCARMFGDGGTHPSSTSSATASLGRPLPGSRRALSVIAAKNALATALTLSRSENGCVRAQHLLVLSRRAHDHGRRFGGARGNTVSVHAIEQLSKSHQLQCHQLLMNESINLCASTARASAASVFASAAANIFSASAARASAALARAWACASATLAAVLARVGASTT